MKEVVAEEAIKFWRVIFLVPQLGARIYPNSAGRRWRFYLRTLLYPLTTLRWLRHIWRQPQLRRLGLRYTALWEKPHRPYFRSDLNASARTELLLDHYRLLNQVDQRSLLRQLRQGPLTLAHFEGRDRHRFEVHLEIAFGLEKEGELKLQLLRDDKPLALLTFFLMRDGARQCLAIGGLQGDTTADQEEFRAATRELETLRPKDALVHAVRAVARAWNVDAIRAVSNQHHIYRAARYRSRHQFAADYDRLWTEVGGVLGADGNYELELNVARRDPATIASKKRAQHARKQAVIDLISAEVQATLGMTIGSAANEAEFRAN